MSTKDLTVGETGRIIRVNAGRDLSSNTDVQLNFTKPSKTIVTKTRILLQVVVGTVDVTDEDLGALLAFQYVEYLTEDGFLDEYGENWSVCLNYLNTVPTPPESFYGNSTVFTVLKPCGDVS